MKVACLNYILLTFQILILGSIVLKLFRLAANS